jgi:N-acyl-D-amino-acid deacylase
MGRWRSIEGGVWSALVVGILLTVAPEWAVAQAVDQGIPITGDAGPGLEPVDRAIVETMGRYGIPGASLAIARNGRLVLAKGYGWADRDGRVPARPETLFALASVSKSLTAVTILRMV